MCCENVRKNHLSLINYTLIYLNCYLGVLETTHFV